MSKQWLFLMVTLLVAITASGLAWACGGCKMGMGQGCMLMPGCNMQDGMTCDPETMKARQAFFDESQELRKALVMKKTQLNAVLRQASPDAAAAATLAGELFDLKTQFHAKAAASGVQINCGCGMKGEMAAPDVKRPPCVMQGSGKE